MLDIPDEVWNKVIADGNAAWLDGLPSVVESLAQEWSLTIGATLRGGQAALVVEATLADGTAAVLKVGVPGTRREITFEATALRLADDDGCASLLRDDLDRGALLLERLGAAIYDVVPDPATRHGCGPARREQLCAPTWRTGCTGPHSGYVRYSAAPPPTPRPSPAPPVGPQHGCSRGGVGLMVPTPPPRLQATTAARCRGPNPRVQPRQLRKPPPT